MKAGLTRKKITVKGRKGAYLRSVLVKITPADKKAIRQDAGVALGHGMARLGQAVGAHVGAHYGGRWGAQNAHIYGVHPYAASIAASFAASKVAGRGGASVGKVVGHNLARKTRMSEASERQAANAAHLGATALNIYGAYKTVKSIHDHFKARSAYRASRP